jgi:F-type H+-transporting ATPase subunit b
MPQFDATTFPSQLFWLLISFVALYWIISRIAVPRIGEVLEQRARVIQDDLDRATQLKAETDQAVAAYERAMAEARAQAGEHIASMQAQAKAVADARTAEVTAQVNTQITNAEIRIAKAKDDAMAGIKALAGETARDVVGKLTGLAPDAGAVDNAVAAALKEAR